MKAKELNLRRAKARFRVETRSCESVPRGFRVGGHAGGNVLAFRERSSEMAAAGSLSRPEGYPSPLALSGDAHVSAPRPSNLSQERDRTRCCQTGRQYRDKSEFLPAVARLGSAEAEINMNFARRELGRRQRSREGAGRRDGRAGCWSPASYVRGRRLQSTGKSGFPGN